MLYTVEFQTPTVKTAQLYSTGFEYKDPIQIRSIDGLGPVAADIQTVKYGNIDGESYNGSTVPKRNIVFTFGFNPYYYPENGYTYEKLRKLLYTYLMPKHKVKMIFAADRPNGSGSVLTYHEITGYVESFSPNIFSKDPEIQVSVICPFPYFIDQQETVQTGYTVPNGSTATTALNYFGTVPVGFTVDIEQAKNSSGNGVPLLPTTLQIINQNTKIEMFSADSVGADNASYLRLSTLSGKKSFQQMYYSGLQSIGLLNNANPNSQFPQLRPGMNAFKIVNVYNTGAYPWTLRYKALYGGL